MMEAANTVGLATRGEKYFKQRRLHFTTISDPHSRCKEATKTTIKATRIIGRMKKELSSITAGLPQQHTSLLTSQELEAIKICSDTFTRIISSNVRSEDLVGIKRFYDNKLDELLRSVNEMKSQSSRPTDIQPNKSLDTLRATVLELRSDIARERDEHSRLQDQYTALTTRKLSPVQPTVDNDSVKDMTTQPYGSWVENTQCQIFVKRKEINNSLKLRTGLVPSTVCQRLEQCIRSSELEIRKLSKTNHKLQKEIQGLETRLKQYLDTEHTSSDELKMLWKTFEKRAETYYTVRNLLTST